MSTFLHGVGTVQYIDKSAELVDLKGLDISSLAKTGVINYEHLSSIPAQLVGKILKAKKIFVKEDCADHNERHFWDKVKAPFLYIMAELLDDYCDSAKHIAGILKYDKDKKDQNEYAIAWFSVEGSEIPNSRGSNKMVVSRGIARKVTITTTPCNQGCAVEILENQAPQIKDDFDEIFKSESNAIKMLKTEEGLKVYEQFLIKKEAEGPSMGGKPPKSPSAEYEGKGIRAGTNKAGEHVYSHGNVRSYSFNPAEHKHSGEHHTRAVVSAQNPKLANNKQGRAALHSNATKSGARVENRAGLSLKDKDKIAQEQGKQQMQMSEKPGDLKKAHVPGSNIAAPHIGVGHSMGSTSTGKEVFSHAKIHDYPNFSSGEHKEAAEMHRLASQNAPTAAEKSHHWDKMKLHTQAANTAGLKESRFKTGLANTKAAAMKHAKMNKSLEAGSTNAAPSTLVNGAAYQSESLRSQPISTGAEDNTFQGTKKKDWKKRAKQDYENWPQREKFEKFMKARMPHLELGEIQAIGRTIALRKSLDWEKSLNSLVKSELDEKSLKDIQIETAKKWAKRAEEAFKKAKEEKSIKWFMDGEEYLHEAIEHSSLSEELSVFEEIRAKLLPIRREVLKLLVPDKED